MIPVEVIEHSKSVMSFLWAAGCDSRGRPMLFRSWCWQIDPGGAQLFFGAPFDEGLRAIGRRVAFGFATPDARAYQLKGDRLDLRDATADDLRLDAQIRKARVEAISAAGFGTATAFAAIMPPVKKVLSVGVDVVFDQTPGPKAGRVIAERKIAT